MNVAHLRPVFRLEQNKNLQNPAAALPEDRVQVLSSCRGLAERSGSGLCGSNMLRCTKGKLCDRVAFASRGRPHPESEKENSFGPGNLHTVSEIMNAHLLLSVFQDLPSEFPEMGLCTQKKTQ